MNEKKIRDILKIMGWVICGLLLIEGIILGIMIIDFHILPVSMFLIAAITIVVITAGFLIAQQWTVSGIVTKVIALMLCAVLALGCLYIHSTTSAIDKMSGISTKVDNINVYVLADDPAESLKDTEDYIYGILKVNDRENTNLVLSDIKSEIGKEVATVEQDDMIILVDKLYSGDEGAIILNSAYLSILEDTEGYGDFETKVKCISVSEYKTEIVNDDADGYLTGDEKLFTVYISGVDTDGIPTVNSNSDVNILLTVNMETGQILMISTPRDFYIPLSISNGVPDKLTHAGGYGIDVSIETLEQYYGINVDYYLKVNFTGFVDIINELGGVEVYSEYDFSAGYTTGDYFHQGYNQMNGEQALAFARERHAFSNGDLQRGKNQMAVIEAVIKKMASVEALTNYTSVIDAVSDSMITSMKSEEISDLVRYQLDKSIEWEIFNYGVYGTGSMMPTYSAGSQLLSVLIPDEASVSKAKELMNMIYNGETITQSDIPAEQ